MDVYLHGEWQIWSSLSSFAITHRLKIITELKTPPLFLFPKAGFDIKVVKLSKDFASYLYEPSLEPVSCIQVCRWFGTLKGRETNECRGSSCWVLSHVPCSEAYWRCDCSEPAVVHAQHHVPPEGKARKLFCSRYKFRPQGSTWPKAPEAQGSNLRT